MNRRLVGTIAIAALAATLSGCSLGNQPDNAHSPTPSLTGTGIQTSAPLPANTSAPTPTPGDVDTETGELISPAPVPSLGAADRSAAVSAAEAAMAAFARPTMDPAAWWDELSPLLTSQARTDYAYVTPSSVPATMVTGGGILTDDSSAFVVHVAVPTDVGDYDILLIRTDGSAPWEVSRLTPPEGVR